MDKMRVPGHVKGMTEDGRATIVFSVFNTVDRGGDVVMPGAFAKAASSPRLPHFVADHHWSVLSRLGKVLALRETAEGAEADVQFNLEKQVARDVYSDFKFAPEAQEFSFSYGLAPDGAETKDGRRYLKEMQRVFELGPVLVGMHEDTRLVGVKAADLVSADLLYVPEDMLTDDFKEALEKAAADRSTGNETGLTTKTAAESHLHSRTWATTPVGTASNLSVGTAYVDIVPRLKAGARNSASDLSTIQQLHDLTMQLGATCPEPDADDQMGKSEEPAGAKDEDPDRFARVRELVAQFPFAG